MLESGSWGHSVLQTPALVYINRDLDSADECLFPKVKSYFVWRHLHSLKGEWIHFQLSCLLSDKRSVYHLGCNKPKGVFEHAQNTQIQVHPTHAQILIQGPVVQSIVSLTRSLRVISLTILGDSIYNIPIFCAEKM